MSANLRWGQAEAAVVQAEREAEAWQERVIR